MEIIRELRDASNAPIVDMDASWTSKTYPMGDNLHLCIHLFWDNVAPIGTVILEYSGDPEAAVAAAAGDTQDEAVNWVAKDATIVDGSYSDLMYLDSNLPVACFRLRFVHVSGSANLQAFIVRKRGR